MQFALDAAGRALISGSSGIDVCQAYLLLSIHPVPKKSFWEDKRWMMMANAIKYEARLSDIQHFTNGSSAWQWFLALTNRQPQAATIVNP